MPVNHTHTLIELLVAVVKTELIGVVGACKVLLHFLLRRLERYNENCAVSQVMCNIA